MDSSPASPPAADPPNIAAGIAARLFQVAIAFGLIAAILFLASGRLNWLWAWVLLGIYLLSVIINSAFMLHTSPETIAERGRTKEMRGWDRLVGGLWGLAHWILLPLIAGLDARFGWTRELGTPWHVAGAVVFAAGLALFGWAMITNAYFSTVVRIQIDRGQTVCRSGPYRFVRHPGYAGIILQSIALPFLLGSLWALIPAAAALGLTIIRTAFEDRILQAELTGYREFVQEVHYRVIPGLW